MIYILLILMFCKNNVLVTFKEYGAVENFFVEFTAYCCDDLMLFGY